MTTSYTHSFHDQSLFQEGSLDPYSRRDELGSDTMSTRSFDQRSAYSPDTNDTSQFRYHESVFSPHLRHYHSTSSLQQDHLKNTHVRYPTMPSLDNLFRGPGQPFSISSSRPSHNLYSYRPASMLISSDTLHLHSGDEDPDSDHQKDDSGFSHETPEEPMYILTANGDVVFYDDSATEYDLEEEPEYEFGPDHGYCLDETELDLDHEFDESSSPLVKMLPRSRSLYFSELDNPNLIAEDELPTDDDDDETVDGEDYEQPQGAEYKIPGQSRERDIQSTYPDLQSKSEFKKSSERHVPLLYQRIYDDEGEEKNPTSPQSEADIIDDDNTTTTGGAFQYLLSKESVNQSSDEEGGSVLVRPSTKDTKFQFDKSGRSSKKSTQQPPFAVEEDQNTSHSHKIGISWTENIFWACFFTFCCHSAIYYFPIIHHIPAILSLWIGTRLTSVLMFTSSFTTGSLFSIFVPEMKMGFRLLRGHRSYPHVKFFAFLLLLIHVAMWTMPHLFEYLYILSRRINVMGPTLVFGMLAYTGALLFISMLWITFSLTRDMSCRLHALLTGFGKASSSSKERISSRGLEEDDSKAINLNERSGDHAVALGAKEDCGQPPEKKKIHSAERPYVYRP